MPKYEAKVMILGYRYDIIEVEADTIEEAEDIVRYDGIVAEDGEWYVEEVQINEIEQVKEQAVYNDHFDAIVGDYTKE